LKGQRGGQIANRRRGERIFLHKHEVLSWRWYRKVMDGKDATTTSHQKRRFRIQPPSGKKEKRRGCYDRKLKKTGRLLQGAVMLVLQGRNGTGAKKSFSRELTEWPRPLVAN